LHKDFLYNRRGSLTSSLGGGGRKFVYELTFKLFKITFTADDIRIFYKILLLIWGLKFRVQVRERLSSSPSGPDRFWGTPNLLPNGYWSSFLGSKAAGV
jgi:hypothetical protein